MFENQVNSYEKSVNVNEKELNFEEKKVKQNEKETNLDEKKLKNLGKKLNVNEKMVTFRRKMVQIKMILKGCLRFEETYQLLDACEVHKTI